MEELADSFVDIRGTLILCADWTHEFRTKARDDSSIATIHDSPREYLHTPDNHGDIEEHKETVHYVALFFSGRT